MPGIETQNFFFVIFIHFICYLYIFVLFSSLLQVSIVKNAVSLFKYGNFKKLRKKYEWCIKTYKNNNNESIEFKALENLYE